MPDNYADQIRMDEALAKKDARIAELEAKIDAQARYQEELTAQNRRVESKELQRAQEQLGKKDALLERYHDEISKLRGELRYRLGLPCHRKASGNGEGNDG